MMKRLLCPILLILACSIALLGQTVHIPKLGFFTEPRFIMPANVDELPVWFETGQGDNNKRSIRNNISNHLYQNDMILGAMVKSEPVVYKNFFAFTGNVESSGVLVIGYTPMTSSGVLNRSQYLIYSDEDFFGTPIIVSDTSGDIIYVYATSIADDGVEKVKVTRFAAEAINSGTSLIDRNASFGKYYYFDPSVFPITADIKATSLTLGLTKNPKIVLTRHGTTSSQSPSGIFIFKDDLTLLGAISANSIFGGNVRFSTPAILTTVNADFIYINSYEWGNPNVQPTSAEVLVVGGVYTSTPAGSGDFKANNVFVIPPSIVASRNSSEAFSNVNAATFLLEDGSGRSFAIGNIRNQFRNEYVLGIRHRGNQIRIDFNSFDVMEYVQAPFKLSWYDDRVGRVATGLDFAPGYALHSPDGAVDFNILPDAALQLFRNNQVVIYKNSYQGAGTGVLSSSYGPVQNTTLVFPGYVSSLNIDGYTFNPNNYESYQSNGKDNWRFYGDNFGPKSIVGYANITDDMQPKYWFSNFSFPVAIGQQAYGPDTDKKYIDNNVYITGTYGGSTNLIGMTPQPVDDESRIDSIYSVNPDTDRHLRQTAITAEVSGILSNDQNALIVTESTNIKALTRGARALVQYGNEYYDIGNITSVVTTGKTNEYVMKFTRAYPIGITFDDMDTYGNPIIARIIVSTSLPSVAHVKKFDHELGMIDSTIGTINETIITKRASEGILHGVSIVEAGSTAVNEQGTLISFSGLNYSCHTDKSFVGKTINDYHEFDIDGNILATNIIGNNGIIFLPRIPIHREAIELQTNEISYNYTTDDRNGKILLSIETAGRYADRFVLVMYTTNELFDDDVFPTAVLHHEVMYVPSQINWQYQFSSGIKITASPSKIGDKLYVPVTYGQDNNLPFIYVFDAYQADPLNVEPRGIITVNGVGSSLTPVVPYRSGFMVGSGSGLHIYADGGFLLADAQRVVRLNPDSSLAYQMTGIVGRNPIDNDGYLQQPFNFITGVERLDNGNLLICDTGLSKIAECDDNGRVFFQYPDANIPGHLNYVLNGPRSVKRYTKNIGGTDYVSYLITDTGNNRIIEVYLSIDTSNNYTFIDAKIVANNLDLKQILGSDVTFTQAERIRPRSEESGIESTAIVVVLSNNKILSSDGKPLRTLLLVKEVGRDLLTLENSGGTPVIANALEITRANDYFSVSQFSLVRMYNFSITPAVEWLYAKVVDGFGIKFIPAYVWDSGNSRYIPVYEDEDSDFIYFRPIIGTDPYIIDDKDNSVHHMRYSEDDYNDGMLNMRQGVNIERLKKYSAAINGITDPLEIAKIEDNIENFASDVLFHPTGFGFSVDNNSINHITINQLMVMQFNKMPNLRYPMRNMITDELRSVPRIHLFALNYNSGSGKWDIFDAGGNIYMVPSPLSLNYPLLSGRDEYLTEPFSMVMD